MKKIVIWPLLAHFSFLILMLNYFQRGVTCLFLNKIIEINIFKISQNGLSGPKTPRNFFWKTARSSLSIQNVKKIISKESYRFVCVKIQIMAYLVDFMICELHLCYKNQIFSWEAQRS